MKKMTASILALALATPLSAASDETTVITTDESEMAQSTDAPNTVLSDETTSSDTANMADNNSDMDMSDDSYPVMIRTRDITGADIYTTNSDGTEAWDVYATYDSIEDSWNDIGSVEDIVLDRDGKMIGVIAEVGGFLDIGDKHVFIETEGVKLVPVDDMNYTFVTGLSKEELMDRENLDEGFWN